MYLNSLLLIFYLTSIIHEHGGHSSGIFLDIYDDNGNPTNAGRTYTPPGPEVISCPGSGRSGLAGSNSNGGSQSSAAFYAQCGEKSWTCPLVLIPLILILMSAS
jgi:hypothetical protein